MRISDWSSDVCSSDLFAFARAGDTVSVEPAAAPNFTITGPFAADLSTLDNLVLAAIDAFAGTFGAPGPLAIGLGKNLPVAAGIGGGSADAAAVLRALARLTQVSPDDPRLAACAVELDRKSTRLNSSH